MTDIAPGGAEPSAFDLEAAVRSLLMMRRTRAARVWAVVFVLAAAVLHFVESEYSATGAFTASSRRPSSGLTGLAAQVGLAIPGLETTNSPQYFAELLRSDEVLRRVSTRPFATRETGTPATLAEIWNVHPADTLLARERVINRLRKSVAVSASQRTGVITYVVRTRDPLLSEGLAKALLEELDVFNRTTRNSQAAAERRFTEGRLEEAKNELRAAEDRLEAFLQGNRLFDRSPELVFRRDRLAREVTTKQEVVNLIAQSYEQARIEEVRDTPALTALESPRHSATPDSGNWSRVVLLAAVVASLVAGVDVLLVFLRRRRSGAAAT